MAARKNYFYLILRLVDLHASFLSYADLAILQFILGLVHNGCDIFLDKIQHKLLEEYGLGMSLSGIWRSLHHLGYSMKKVDTGLYIQRKNCSQYFMRLCTQQLNAMR